jgi:hypothetical protein
MITNHKHSSTGGASILKHLLEMTRVLLGGSGAWLLESRGETTVVVDEDVSGRQPARPPDGLLAAWLRNTEHEMVSWAGSNYICMDVLRSGDGRAAYYVVVVSLSSQIDFGQRLQGMLDGLRCAYAAACVDLGRGPEVNVPSQPEDFTVSCSACHRVQISPGVWSHWDHLNNRRLCLGPLTHTICEPCAVKFYGLHLARQC